MRNVLVHGHSCSCVQSPAAAVPAAGFLSRALQLAPGAPAAAAPAYSGDGTAQDSAKAASALPSCGISVVHVCDIHRKPRPVVVAAGAGGAPRGLLKQWRECGFMGTKGREGLKLALRRVNGPSRIAGEDEMKRLRAIGGVLAAKQKQVWGPLATHCRSILPSLLLSASNLSQSRR